MLLVYPVHGGSSHHRPAVEWFSCLAPGALQASVAYSYLSRMSMSASSASVIHTRITVGFVVPELRLQLQPTAYRVP